ncbi:MAG: nucleotidyltransferase domain-containing protein [Nanoarchaeota archaeon]
MEQKDYKLEIIDSLLEKNRHIRALAKKLKVNHMIILRKLKDLYDGNIVDYTEEGKNKVYFLKKTTEAKSYVFITENYKLSKILKKHPFLRNIIEKTQENNKIKIAVLFGSYAKDTEKDKSDIDIYVETINRKIKKDLESINSRVSVKIGKYDKKSPLIKEIEKNHIIIKGVEEFYGRYKFFD